MPPPLRNQVREGNLKLIRIRRKRKKGKKTFKKTKVGGKRKKIKGGNENQSKFFPQGVFRGVSKP